MNRIDADTELRTRVTSIISGEHGTFMGICPCGRAEVSFDDDVPGFIDDVDPATLTVEEC